MNFTVKDKTLGSTSTKAPKRRSRRKWSEANNMNEIIFIQRVKQEMVRLGATEADLALIHPNMVRSALQNKRTPRDVAWAIMQ